MKLQSSPPVNLQGEVTGSSPGNGKSQKHHHFEEYARQIKWGPDPFPKRQPKTTMKPST